MATRRIPTLKCAAVVYISIAFAITLLAVGSTQTGPMARPRAPSPTGFASTIFLNTSIGRKIEYELQMSSGHDEPQRASKLALVLIEVTLFGFLGADRCYMGQVWIGIIKGLTLGGLGIWAFIDYLNVMFNAILFKSSISSMGFTAIFEDQGVAGFVAWVGLFLNCCCPLIRVFYLFFGAAAGREVEDDEYRSIPEKFEDEG
mmetsp:Transcript_89802/g.200983  ORF Transcript_89802/g.200983 Transcript_89802/m.200983 type:complete len:202 (-) Transcript_89802:197-802(-)